ncbi:MAG: hypothetical protein JNJ55_13930 [Betaproteobacteria bacterium]|nr:hypothetical protein [Betaproteobacteria bacterium]
MNAPDRNHEASLRDAQDQLINAAASGRPSARHVRFSKAAVLEGSMSIIDPRLWPLHAAALSFALLVLAAVLGIGKPASPDVPAGAVAVVCSLEEQCNVIDPIDGGPVVFEPPKQIAQPERRTPMIAPGDQFSIATPRSKATQSSDARPMIDYTLPANL